MAWNFVINIFIKTNQQPIKDMLAYTHVHVYNKYLASTINLETGCNKIYDDFDHMV